MYADISIGDNRIRGRTFLGSYRSSVSFHQSLCGNQSRDAASPSSLTRLYGFGDARRFHFFSLSLGLTKKTRRDNTQVRMADKRHVYAVNITAKSFFPDDLYQGFLKPSESSNEDEAPWIEAVLPFDRFLLTSYGYEKELQREMNTDCIYTIGFTVMSETPGPFRLEIDSIRAVPFEDVADVGDSRNVNNISLSEKDEDRAERIRLSIERRRRLVKKNKEENDE